MSFEQWLRKKWYIAFLSTLGAAAVVQFLYPASYSMVLGFLGGLAITYLIYRAEQSR